MTSVGDQVTMVRVERCEVPSSSPDKDQRMVFLAVEKGCRMHYTIATEAFFIWSNGHKIEYYPYNIAFFFVSLVSENCFFCLGSFLKQGPYLGQVTKNGMTTP